MHYSFLSLFLCLIVNLYSLKYIFNTFPEQEPEEEHLDMNSRCVNSTIISGLL